jgi:hypothetical protein
MRGRQASHALITAAALALALTAPTALASFTSTLNAGSITLTSNTLAAPSATAAANNPTTCKNNKPATLTINLTWTPTTSAWATGYTILRSSTSGGPYTQTGTTNGPNTTSWTDNTATLAFSTSYYYVVQATYLAWTSTNSNEATITTLTHLCA